MNRPSQPQSIGEVLDTSFRLYRASIGTIWPLCLLLVVADAPAAIYTFVHGGFAMTSALDPLAVMALLQDRNYWIVNLLGGTLTLWGVGALLLQQHAIGNGSTLAVSRALQLSFGKMMTLLIVSLLYVVATVVGTILLLVPGAILSVSLALSWNIALVTSRGPLQSLIDSHVLIWDYWWHTSAILSVAFLIALVLYIAVAVVTSMAIPLSLNTQNAALSGLISELSVGLGAGLLIVPCYTALLHALHWDLTLRKQGGMPLRASRE